MTLKTPTRATDSEPSAPVTQATRRIRKPASELWLRNLTVGTVMASIVVLLLIPIGIAFVGSFHDWNPLNGTFDFTGVDNYAELFADATFWRASGNTLIFGILAIVGRVVLGLAIAYALFSKLSRWRTFFRTIFYLPTVMPLVAVAFLWKLMYNPQFVKYDFGYASAIAFVLLIITAVLTAASWRMNQSALDAPRRRRFAKRSERKAS